MAFPSRCTETPMSHGENSQYTRTHQYSAGSGRALLQSCPGTFYAREDSLQLEPLKPAEHQFAEGEFVPRGFRENVNPNLFAVPNPARDWTYSNRRQAQMLLPFLYLGPWTCLKDRRWLQEEGFTLLLAVRDRRLAQVRLVSGEKVATEMEIESDTVDIVGNQELISILPRAIRRINNHVFSHSVIGHGKPPKIFIFCETGNGVSAVVIIAYLMVMFNAELPQAIHAVHLQRFCIETDDESRMMLASFGSILAAKRDVEQTQRSARMNCLSPGIAPRATSRKRNIAYCNEMETGDGMDVDDIGDQNGLRKPLGPFQDRSE
ncbi:hypothetical protein FE257_002255 [Aspergillus nanangensis]|uniref:Tyrosine-protein phosphatase domain-containing protein n=1 Tax=Aspergillus nanangensis TaxID=2582783 RepID=A0AAD4CCV7_ASPNN|nr:hypothetical protein FE257_002255 [Aspergillus nanangensis]